MMMIIIIMALGHLLPSSGLTHPEVPSIVFPGSFCLPLLSFVIIPAIRYESFCWLVVASSFCSPVFCPILGLYLILLQSLCSFYNLRKCNTLFFSYMFYLGQYSEKIFVWNRSRTEHLIHAYAETDKLQCCLVFTKIIWKLEYAAVRTVMFVVQ
jgi:hypothetical protein